MHRTKLRECINDYAAKIIRFGVFVVISARHPVLVSAESAAHRNNHFNCP